MCIRANMLGYKSVRGRLWIWNQNQEGFADYCMCRRETQRQAEIDREVDKTEKDGQRERERERERTFTEA